MTVTKILDNLTPSKPNLKHQHRSAIGISADILRACMDAGGDGIIISKISQKANLSYGTTMDNCQKLIDANMVKSIKKEGKHIFMITEKGIRFFKEFQKFLDYIKEIKIRY